ncbi:MAG: helix-turn-helix domain-containing protein [Pelovirga sp.]
MFWIVLFLLLLGGLFYLYQKMKALEQQIRAEQALEKASQQLESTAADSATELASAAQNPSRTVSPAPASDGQSINTACDPVLHAIDSQPGVLQADIYDQLRQFKKRQVQQMIRQLVEDGKVRRERAGNSYQLYLT